MNEFREDKLVRDVQAMVVNNIIKIIDGEIEVAKEVNPQMAMGMLAIKEMIKKEFGYND